MIREIIAEAKKNSEVYTQDNVKVGDEFMSPNQFIIKITKVTDKGIEGLEQGYKDVKIKKTFAQLYEIPRVTTK